MKSYILLFLVVLIGAVWATATNEEKSSNKPVEKEAVGPAQIIEAPVIQNFFDDFEAYTAGTPLTVQNSTDWTTWSGGSGTVEDPLVTNAQSFSGTNSVVIIQNNDVVKVFDVTPITTGTWILSWQMYIPNGKAGYFNTLATFDPPAHTNTNWAMQAYFNVGGGGTLDAGGANAATFTYAYDTWIPVEVVVDLDNDVAEFWLDGSMIHTWQYTLGTFGGGSPLQLDANDFFGNTANDEMYIDDYSVRACTPGLLGDVNDDGFSNSTDALIILSYDAGLPIPQPILDRINLGFADTNDDGLTNSTDALLLLSFDAGIPVPFPVGDPVCL